MNAGAVAGLSEAPGADVMDWVRRLVAFSTTSATRTSA